MKGRPESLISKFLDDVNAWTDRFCTKCGKVFRTKMAIPHYKCPDCYLEDNQ